MWDGRGASPQQQDAACQPVHSLSQGLAPDASPLANTEWGAPAFRNSSGRGALVGTSCPRLGSCLWGLAPMLEAAAACEDRRRRPHLPSSCFATGGVRGQEGLDVAH